MIPADHVTIDGDRVLIVDRTPADSYPASWDQDNKPCDTCGGIGDQLPSSGDWRHCRDCSGTRRHVFTIDVEVVIDGVHFPAEDEYRVYVERILPIVDESELVSGGTHSVAFIDGRTIDELGETHVTLPPAARSGMWLVECRTVPDDPHGSVGSVGSRLDRPVRPNNEDDDTPENVECPVCNGVGSVYPAPYQPGMEGDPCDNCVEGQVPAPPPENPEEPT